MSFCSIRAAEDLAALAANCLEGLEVNGIEVLLEALFAQQRLAANPTVVMLSTANISPLNIYCVRPRSWGFLPYRRGHATQGVVIGVQWYCSIIHVSESHIFISTRAVVQVRMKLTEPKPQAPPVEEARPLEFERH